MTNQAMFHSTHTRFTVIIHRSPLPTDFHPHTNARILQLSPCTTHSSTGNRQTHEFWKSSLRSIPLFSLHYASSSSHPTETLHFSFITIPRSYLTEAVTWKENLSVQHFTLLLTFHPAPNNPPWLLSFPLARACFKSVHISSAITWVSTLVIFLAQQYLSIYMPSAAQMAGIPSKRNAQSFYNMHALPPRPQLGHRCVKS